MNEYIIAYISFFNNRLEQHRVEGVSEVQVARDFLERQWECYNLLSSDFSILDLEDLCSDSDCRISVFPV